MLCEFIFNINFSQTPSIQVRKSLQLKEVISTLLSQVNQTKPVPRRPPTRVEVLWINKTPSLAPAASHWLLGDKQSKPDPNCLLAIFSSDENTDEPPNVPCQTIKG